MVVQVITMLECPETMSKSCFKKWYRVTSWGDHYYSLGCSDTEPQPETVARRVGVGGITAVITLSLSSLSLSSLSFCRVSVESTVTTSVQETTATQAEVLEPSQF